MPRRNKREHAPPIGLSPADLANLPRPKSLEQVRRDREAEERRRRAQAAAQRRERRNAAIDWATCLVPECDDSPISGLPEDSDIRLPLCCYHETMVWRTVQRYEGRPDVIEASQQLAAESAERSAEARRRHLAKQEGHIYYIRLNGLIKVGWSRDVDARLRAYGPDVEVFTFHPGTRTEETDLHRNLRPFLARGREWYEDCPAMRDIIAKVVERHGSRRTIDTWTRPKPAVIKPRAWRGSA